MLIVALIIGNILISLIEPTRKQKYSYVTTTNTTYAQEPEIIEHMENQRENNALIRGSLTATNKKIEILTQRVSILEKVLMSITEEKIEQENSKSKY